MTTDRVFELRTYKANPGKFAALQDRFRNHTTKLFGRHGLTVMGFFTPEDDADTLVYLLAFESETARKKAWENFLADPDWIKARDDSQPDGNPLVASLESRVLHPTDYSSVR